MPHPIGKEKSDRSLAALKITIGEEGPAVIRNWRHSLFSVVSVTAPVLTHYISLR